MNVSATPAQGHPGLLLIPLLLFFLSGCQQPDARPVSNPLEQILASEDPAIARVMANPEKYEVQIRYTRIQRSGDSVNFTDYDYQVDSSHYYSPASTVKFPIAVAALEKLNELDSLDRNTRYYIEGDTVENSFAEDIVKIFAVSDNHANNRLFEFLGQDDINRRLRKKQAGPVRISHRLGFHRDELTTQPLVIYLNDSLLTSGIPILNSPIEPLELTGDRKGNGYYAEDSLVMEPFDFRLKNHLPLATLHGLMERVVFPEAFPPTQRFDLSSDQHDFLLNTMKIVPTDHIEIYNTVGFAYGTLTDCAYIRDTQSGIEFLVSATILVNEDGIFNDDNYEYESIGLPFLASLGRGLYQFELSLND
ncbi:MAG: serine hydrolase [Robiginitalea sp.]